MPSFEEDAFARAQQMHRRRPQNQSQVNFKTTQANNQPPKPQESPVTEPKEVQIPAPQTQKSVPSSENVKSDSFLNVLFKDKDQSIILLLIVLLMEENSNPTLLIALIYLLI